MIQALSESDDEPGDVDPVSPLASNRGHSAPAIRINANEPEIHHLLHEVLTRWNLQFPNMGSYSNLEHHATSEHATDCERLQNCATGSNVTLEGLDNSSMVRIQASRGVLSDVSLRDQVEVPLTDTESMDGRSNVRRSRKGQEAANWLSYGDEMDECCTTISLSGRMP